MPKLGELYFTTVSAHLHIVCVYCHQRCRVQTNYTSELYSISWRTKENEVAGDDSGKGTRDACSSCFQVNYGAKCVM